MCDTTLVKILVTKDEDPQEMSFYQFLDDGPDFVRSNQLLDIYIDTPGVSIRIWHLDPPEKPPHATHEGSMRIN